MFQNITILVRYDNEEGQQEARYQGYLTGTESAMYVNEYNKLMFSQVEPTDDPAAYLEISCARELGSIKNATGDEKTTIERLANILNSMTAYDFLAKVLIHVQHDLDLDELIIPKLIEGR